MSAELAQKLEFVHILGGCHVRKADFGGQAMRRQLFQRLARVRFCCVGKSCASCFETLDENWPCGKRGTGKSIGGEIEESCGDFRLFAEDKGLGWRVVKMGMNAEPFGGHAAQGLAGVGEIGGNENEVAGRDEGLSIADAHEARAGDEAADEAAFVKMWRKGARKD